MVIIRPGQNYVKDVLVVTHLNKDNESLQYLCGLLNSKLMSFYYETSFPTLHVQRDELASLPIPSMIIHPMSEKIAGHVADIIALQKQKQTTTLPENLEQLNQRIAYTDEKINKLVYELYGLSEEEIAIVEGRNDV